MKFLTIGTGVIGTTYSWQFSLQGHEATHFVRKEKLEFYKKNGIKIDCLDGRKKKTPIKTRFRPQFIDTLVNVSEYDFILVAVNCEKLESILLLLQENKVETNIVFMMNFRPNNFGIIENYLKTDQYLFAYPFIAGGSTENGIIQNVIYGNPFFHTMIGEPNGNKTVRLQNLYQILKAVKMHPVYCENIEHYMKAHYIWAACAAAAYIEAGNYRTYVKEALYIRRSYQAMKEAWKICEKQGIHADKMIPTKFFYLPLSIIVPISQKMYDNEMSKRVVEGHVRHSPEEMVTMYYDILNAGKKYGVTMPTFLSFKKSIDSL